MPDRSIATSLTIQGLLVARGRNADDYDTARLELNDRLTNLETLVLDLMDLLATHGITFDEVFEVEHERFGARRASDPRAGSTYCGALLGEGDKDPTSRCMERRPCPIHDDWCVSDG